MSTRRLLVLNANTSARATAAIAAFAQRHARGDTALEVTHPAAGPAGIDGAFDAAISGAEICRMAAAADDRCDAIVIACGNDPGLDGAREVARVPVVGIAEAGMLLACTIGARFAIPVLAPAKVAGMRSLVQRYGLIDRLAAVVPMDVQSSGAAFADQERLYAALETAGRTARERDHADVFVLTGSAMAGHEERLAHALGMPVVAGLAAAIALAETLVDLRLVRAAATTHPKESSNA